MVNLEQLIKNIPESDFPADLHQRIMRRVFMRRFRIYFLTVFFVVSANLGLSAWRIWERMIDSQALPVFQTFFEGFELSYDFVYNFFQLFGDYFSFKVVLIFLANLFLIVYLICIYLAIKKYQAQRSSRLQIQ